MINKPKPTIENIVLTEQQQQEVNTMLEGKKLNSNFTGIKKVPPHNNTKKILKDKYFGGFCHICQDFPSYKVTYEYDNAILKEFYCQDCFKTSGIE